MSHFYGMTLHNAGYPKNLTKQRRMKTPLNYAGLLLTLLERS